MTPPASIERHLSTRLVMLTLLISATAGATLYTYVRATLLAQFDGALAAKARIFVSLVKQEVKDGVPSLDFDDPAGLMKETRRGTGAHVELFELSHEDGTSISRSASLVESVLLNAVGRSRKELTFTPVTLPGGAAARAMQMRFSPPLEDEERRAIDRAGFAGAQTPPRLILTVARESREVDRPLQVLLSALIVSVAGMCLASVVGVRWTIRRGLRPLRAVADAAARVDVQSLDYRFPLGQLPDELRPICSRLNDLLARIEESFRRERRFSADVAHELRTPIAELRALAEVALKWPEDSESAARSFQDALSVATQMEGIVAILLSLSRCNAGRQPVAPEAVDVADVVRAAWRPLAPRAQRANLTCLLPAGDASIVTETDRAMLTSIISNLLSNAVAHAPRGGRVLVEIRRHQKNLTIRFGNTNDTLAPEDLLHLFEAFWRKDPARTGGEHTGLGLALVDAFTCSLGGAIRAELAAPDWFDVSLTLPQPDLVADGNATLRAQPFEAAY